MPQAREVTEVERRCRDKRSYLVPKSRSLFGSKQTTGIVSVSIRFSSEDDDSVVL